MTQLMGRLVIPYRVTQLCRSVFSQASHPCLHRVQSETGLERGALSDCERFPVVPAQEVQNGLCRSDAGINHILCKRRSFSRLSAVS